MEEDLKVFMNKTISDLENNIHYKEDLKYIKIKLVEILNKYNKKISKLNEEINNLRKEVNHNTKIDISCPYCNKKIWIENNVNVNEVTCPKCFNLIEIGWKY